MTHTITAGVEINHAANAHIDNAQEALILLLELLLVEDLDRKNALLGHTPVCPSARFHTATESGEGVLHIKALVPVRIQRLFDHARGLRLFPADGSNRKGIWKAEQHTLGVLGFALFGIFCSVKRRLRRKHEPRREAQQVEAIISSSFRTFPPQPLYDRSTRSRPHRALLLSSPSLLGWRMGFFAKHSTLRGQ